MFVNRNLHIPIEIHKIQLDRKGIYIVFIRDTKGYNLWYTTMKKKSFWFNDKVITLVCQRVVCPELTPGSVQIAYTSSV